MDSAGIIVALGLFSLFLPNSIEAKENPVPAILKKYGLPAGLLPDAVKNYTLDDDGNFEVELEKNCYVHFSYLVYYGKKISGKLSYGKIRELSGVQAKELFFWVSITAIEVDLPDSKYIYFKVGFISKKLDISDFEEVPECKKKVSTWKWPCLGRRSAPALVDVQ